MAGRAFVVAKEVFDHNDRDMFTLWRRLNDEKHVLVWIQIYWSTSLFLGEFR